MVTQPLEKPMHYPAELNLLFPTDLAETGDQVGHAVTRLAASCRVHLTIVHVLRRGANAASARAALDACLPGLDGAVRCSRVLVHGEDPVAEIGALCASRRIDLVIAPEAPTGLARVLGRSLQARLLAACGVPVWAVGRSAAGASDGGPLRSIACLVDLERPSWALLHVAAPLARACGASLTLLHVVPPVDDEALHFAASPRRAFSVSEARHRLAGLAASAGVQANIMVARGHLRRELANLLAQAHADVLFAARGTLASGPFSMSRALDSLPCPAVCVDVPAAPVWWVFENGAGVPAGPAAAPVAAMPSGEPALAR
jgi:hypothetical protein